MHPHPAQSVSFSEFRAGLAEYLDRIVQFGERITVRRHSRDEVVVISKQEWDEVAETLRVIGDPDLFRQIMDSQRDIDTGRVRDAGDAFAELDAEE